MTKRRDELEGLSPERQQLVEQLLRKKKEGNPPRAPVEGDASFNATPNEISEDSGLKGQTRSAYEAYHEKCDSTVYGQYSFFMNLGYVANENRQFSPIKLPPHLPNLRSIKLALETFGDYDLSGRRVLDVGSGRGGIVYCMHRFYKPASTVGVDLSPSGVAFCRRTHKYENAEFFVGDAENLPVDAASFDVVTNVESSHSYPNRVNFYRGVERALKPGGRFLYSDVLALEEFESAREIFQSLKLVIERDQNITQNVLLSCDETAREQYAAFARSDEDTWLANAVGLPGSDVYNGMKEGVTEFRAFRLRKD